MSHKYWQSSSKNLLHNYGKCHKTHSMTIRQEGQTALYDDTEDTSNPHNITALPTTPSSNSIMDLNGKTATEYSEETGTQRQLAQLQEHLKWLQEKLDQLGTAMNTPAYTEELAHSTEKLQKLALMLHSCPTHRPVDQHIHAAVQQYTDTLCATQWQTNLTTSLLQDISTFDGWDTSTLEDWLSDIDNAANILRESYACLAMAKSWDLTHSLVCEALQANIWDILHLKLCNTNIHSYTTCFMEIQQKGNETLEAYVHHFKIEAKKIWL